MLEWVAFPSAGDLPDPGIEPRIPALQADSLPSEPQRKPIKGNKPVQIHLRILSKGNKSSQYRLKSDNKQTNVVLLQMVDTGILVYGDRLN